MIGVGEVWKYVKGERAKVEVKLGFFRFSWARPVAVAYIKVRLG